MAEFNEETLWFLGSSIALILAGLFNLLYFLVPTVQVGTFLVNINLIITGLFCVALNVLNEGQVYAGIVLFALASILGSFKSSEDAEPPFKSRKGHVSNQFKFDLESLQAVLSL